MKDLHCRFDLEVYEKIINSSNELGISMNEFVAISVKKFDCSKHLFTKVCVACLVSLPLESYGNKKGGKFSKASKCKECVQDKQRSKEGRISQMYTSQRKACVMRGHSYPTYTFSELADWCLSQDIFHRLYDDWVLSGFDKKLSPSCDRDDDYKSYSFDNIKLTTWGDNLQNEWIKRKGGINNKQSNTVVQYTLEGIFVCEFVSSHAASRATNVNRGNIGSCCRGKTKSAGGFKWEYKK